MGHLNGERLARIVSEGPTAKEAEHLESCSYCTLELKALEEQTEAVGSLPDLRPPSGDWEALEARLVSEGLVRSSGLAQRNNRWWSTGWFQAAAAVILFLGGATFGSGLMDSRGQEELAQGAPLGELELIPVSGGALPVSNLTEAAEAVNLAERYYMDALLQYRQLLDSQGDPTYIGDPTARFAAIETVVAAAGAAVQKSPADPYLNGVLVSALAERQAILRNASLTPGNGVF